MGQSHTRGAAQGRTMDGRTMGCSKRCSKRFKEVLLLAVFDAGRGQQQAGEVGLVDAFVASPARRYTNDRAAQLVRLGFAPRRVAPVYLSAEEHLRRGCKLTAKQAGVFAVHVHMWKTVSELLRRPDAKALLLEDDWSIGAQNESDVAAELRRIELRDDDWQLIGHCHGTSCTTAYYLSQHAARQLSDAQIDPCEVGDCPVDWFLETLASAGLIRSYVTPRQAPFGRLLNGTVDWSQDGLFQQDQRQFADLLDEDLPNKEGSPVRRSAAVPSPTAESSPSSVTHHPAHHLVRHPLPPPPPAPPPLDAPGLSHQQDSCADSDIPPAARAQHASAHDGATSHPATRRRLPPPRPPPPLSIIPPTLPPPSTRVYQSCECMLRRLRLFEHTRQKSANAC